MFSENLGPSSWKPSGKPFVVCPAGMASPGIPAIFAGAVKISAKYIFSGSSFFSPNLNGGVGETGAIIASTWEKALSKSSIIFTPMGR